MAYTVDLTTVLKLLFHIMITTQTQITPTPVSQLSGKTTWSELKRAFDDYEGKGSRQRIHNHFCDIFQNDQQILGSEASFHRIFYDLLKDERPSSRVPMSVSVSGSGSRRPPKAAPPVQNSAPRLAPPAPRHTPMAVPPVLNPAPGLAPLAPSPAPPPPPPPPPDDAPSWCRRICPCCFSP
jgi:hypothetical protein